MVCCRNIHKQNTDALEGIAVEAYRNCGIEDTRPFRKQSKTCRSACLPPKRSIDRKTPLINCGKMEVYLLSCSINGQRSRRTPEVE